MPDKFVYSQATPDCIEFCDLSRPYEAKDKTRGCFCQRKRVLITDRDVKKPHVPLNVTADRLCIFPVQLIVSLHTGDILKEFYPGQDWIVKEVYGDGTTKKVVLERPGPIGPANPRVRFIGLAEGQAYMVELEHFGGYIMVNANEDAASIINGFFACPRADLRWASHGDVRGFNDKW